jgi:hypothetical protein
MQLAHSLRNFDWAIPADEIMTQARADPEQANVSAVLITSFP